MKEENREKQLQKNYTAWEKGWKNIFVEFRAYHLQFSFFNMSISRCMSYVLWIEQGGW